MNITSLFNIPAWSKVIPNFDNDMKIKLLDLLREYPEKRNGIQKFYTNRQSVTSGMIDKFSKIISVELDELTESLNNYSDKKFDIKVDDVWSASYDEGDYQMTHNHSSTGLSGILYVDSPQDGPSTNLMQPWNDWISDTTKYTSLKFRSGSMIVLPSFINHSSEPNPSKMRKRIISWDMKIVDRLR